MFKKMSALFHRLVVWLIDPDYKPNTQPSIVTVDPKLLARIDDSRQAEIEKLLAILAINVHRLVDEQHKTQEYMVHLSTLHEELLNQLDQGNIAMVKVRQQTQQQAQDEEMESLMYQEPEDDKKKTELN